MKLNSSASKSNLKDSAALMMSKTLAMKMIKLMFEIETTHSGG